jgi:hypothetical protein
MVQDMATNEILCDLFQEFAMLRPLVHEEVNEVANPTL